MSDDGRLARILIGPESKPALAPHVKLRHDATRDQWVILAPERIFTPDAIAVAVLKLCDGLRSVTTIAAELAQDYGAPDEQILADVTSMLQDLADKGVIKA